MKIIDGIVKYWMVGFYFILLVKSVTSSGGEIQNDALFYTILMVGSLILIKLGAVLDTIKEQE